MNKGLDTHLKAMYKGVVTMETIRRDRCGLVHLVFFVLPRPSIPTATRSQIPGGGGGGGGGRCGGDSESEEGGGG
jgi:hypothetical protein